MSAPLTSLNKTLDALEAFAEQPEWTLTGLSARLELTRPSLHRILRNLEARGYVHQDPQTKRYRLGLKLWELGTLAIGGLDLQRTARTSLQTLADATGEQVTLWIYGQGEAICVDRAEGSQRVRSHTQLGTREPAHLLASGRCLLAFVDERELHRALASTDGDGPAGELPAQLRTIRDRGFAVSRGDRWPDVYAVAAPVLDYTGHAVAALTVSGPNTRFDDAHIARFAAEVADTAHTISKQLGHMTTDAAQGVRPIRRQTEYG